MEANPRRIAGSAADSRSPNSLRTKRWNVTAAETGFPGSPKTSVDLRKVMQKRLSLTGSTLRPRPSAFKAELARSIEEAVWPVIAQGRYKPVVDKLFSLEDVVEAHRRIDGGEHIGKIILTVTD